MKELYIKLASHIQAAKLANHNAHHVCKMVGFFADHEAFANFYTELDKEYDSVMERCIGLHGSENAMLQPQLQMIAAKLQQFPSASAPDNSTLFSFVLGLEQELLSQCEQICKLPETREAEKQLFGDIANRSAMRQYKIKQRIKK